MNLKPGDLVEPNWSFNEADHIKSRFGRQLGLVLSYPEIKDHGTTCVKVNWFGSGYELEEYYSVHHLRLANDGHSL